MEEQLKGEINEVLENIKDVWILNHIYRFVIYMSKDDLGK